MLAAIGCAAGVLVGGILALVLLFADDLFGSHSREDSTPAHVAPTPSPPTTAPMEEPRPPPRDPFVGGEPLPPEIASIHERVLRGARLEEPRLRPVSRYASEHTQDPRPRLILAHARMNRNWMEGDHGALSTYLSAYVLDPSVRGDPRMLGDFLRAVREGDARTSHGASDFVTAEYGEEARPAIEAQLRGRLPANERAKLEELLQRIQQAQQSPQP
jgi:hypothetical protein